MNMNQGPSIIDVCTEGEIGLAEKRYSKGGRMKPHEFRDYCSPMGED